jgi:hypothetical protein
MIRGWRNAGSSGRRRAEAISRRMAAVKIGRNIVTDWWWWEAGRFCDTWRSDGGLWRLLAAPALVELVRSFING